MKVAMSEPEQANLSCPMVLLKHALPNGSSHYDWLLATDSEGVRPLRTFRVTDFLPKAKEGSRISAEAIAEHRPAYLTYEGPVSRGRGHVLRVAEGQYERVSQTGRSVQLLLFWTGESHIQRCRLTPVDEELQNWLVDFLEIRVK